MPEEEIKVTEDEIVWARRSHTLTYLFYPLFIILLLKGVMFAFPIAMLTIMMIPIFILFTKGRKSGFVAIHAKESIFLQFAGIILGFGADYLWKGTDTMNRILQVISFSGLSLYHFVATTSGAIKSSYKKLISYPLSFFKKELKPRDNFEEQMKELNSLQNLDKVTSTMLKESLKLGASKIAELDSLSLRIKDESVKQKVIDIREIVFKIYENFKKDPNDIKVSRQFLSYYLDTTIKIVKKYIELSEQKVISKELSDSLQKVDALLGNAKIAFEKHYEKLLQNDIMDLDAEITVMEKTMKLEGL